LLIDTMPEAMAEIALPFVRFLLFVIPVDRFVVA
jgi:hypothetical protein